MLQQKREHYPVEKMSQYEQFRAGAVTKEGVIREKELLREQELETKQQIAAIGRFKGMGGATFFVTGEHAEIHPDIIERMASEGHLIGNHTYSHIQLRKGNRETFKEELIKTNEILKEITGKEVQYVLSPYGSWDKSFEKELNMFPVLWTVDPLDWSSRNVGRITEKIVSKTGENDIGQSIQYAG